MKKAINRDIEVIQDGEYTNRGGIVRNLPVFTGSCNRDVHIPEKKHDDRKQQWE